MLPWYGLLPIKCGALGILCHISHTPSVMRLLHIIVTSDANAEFFTHSIWCLGNPFYDSGYLAHLANNWATWESQAETAQSIFGRFWHLSKALGNRYGCLFYYHE